MHLALTIGCIWAIISIATANAWAWFRFVQKQAARANHSISANLHGRSV